MSYARKLRRGMKPHLQLLGSRIIGGKFWICRTTRGAWAGDRYCHPTKGWRYPGIRSGHATALTEEIRRGLTPWSSYRFADILRAEGIIE